MKLWGAYREVLKERDFRRYFIGEGISSVGDAMSDITIVMLAVSLVDKGDRPMGIAVAAASYLVPSVLTGVLLARRIGHISGRTLLLVDNLWRGVLLGLASVLAVTEQLSFAGCVALLALASVTRPLGGAGTRAIVVQLIPAEKLFAANSVIGSATQAASLIGPAGAGLTIAWLGPGTALGMDALSFLLFVGLLLRIRPPRRTAVPPSDDVAAASESDPRRAPTGLRKLLGIRQVGTVFGLTAVFYLLYGPFVVGLPLLMDERAGGLAPATALGALWTSFGVGAIVGGLAAGRMTTLVRTRVAALSAAGWGLAMTAVALPAPLIVAGLAMFAGGLVYAPYGSIVSTILQRELPDHRLNEASSYYISMTNIAVPAGTFIGGVSVGWLGAGQSILAAGVLLTAVALLVWAMIRTADRAAPREQQPKEQTV
ncbi:MFS transporter [Streptomyces sp. NBC_01408]|uniref:MFS transporter n=1 Tax=Streptomyces sp. NBC_01408 TaxID=2903855 RepID=UPI002251EB4D|nr:MFS transporter [Streptomyces sp. NBC_01408]MCX4692769.1 MFS transporter [Streptomyces sp. NBC_01408]